MEIKNIILLVITLLIVSCSTKKENNQKQESSWKVVWNEEFEGKHLDTTKWTKISRGTADWNNYMSNFDSCYAMRNGKLILKGFKNTFLAQDTALYLTGGVYTKNKVEFTYGKLSIRAKLNSATGAWPAFWMLPADGSKWPLGGEIDIMERLNDDDFVYQTIHSTYTLDLGIKKNPISGSTNSINTNDFNVYSLIKYTDSLVFLVNDTHTFTYPKIKTDKENQFPFNRPFYLLLDMQLGGDWVGEIKDSDLPVEMEIDWVRFYELK